MDQFAALNLGSLHLDLIPSELIIQASQKLLQVESPVFMSYGELQGNLNLRNKILTINSSYYGKWIPQQMLLTYGASEAISLVTRALVKPGDLVAVEAPTYRWAIPEFLAQGANFVQIPVDKFGMNVDVLEETIRLAQKTNQRLRLIYCMPTFQNPSGVTLSLSRRKRLIELAHQFQFFILEDDPYFKLRYNGFHLPPLIALDKKGVVIHTSSFSKILAPGVRIGWILTKSPALNLIINLKPNGTNPFIAAIILNYLSNNDFSLGIEKYRKFYKNSCKICTVELRKFTTLGFQMLFKPDGGFYYWLKLPNKWSASKFTAYCYENKIGMLSGDDFYVEKPIDQCIRLSFSALNHTFLRKSLQNLFRVAKEYTDTLNSK